jgi:hypothetical protein
MFIACYLVFIAFIFLLNAALLALLYYNKEILTKFKFN